MIKYILGLIINLINPGVSLFAKIDNKSKINKNAKIYGGSQVLKSSIDAYSYIGRRTSVVNARIGKFCSISGDCNIGLGTHTIDKLSTSSIFTEKNNGTKISWVKNDMVDPYKDVIIGNDVWIGAKAMIVGGISVGDGAVIGAGAVVTKDIPPYAIVGGVPAKIIRYRFEQSIIDQLLKLQWWYLPEDKLKRNIGIFQKNLISKDDLDELLKNNV